MANECNLVAVLCGTRGILQQWQHAAITSDTTTKAMSVARHLLPNDEKTEELNDTASRDSLTGRQSSSNGTTRCSTMPRFARVSHLRNAAASPPHSRRHRRPHTSRAGSAWRPNGSLHRRYAVRGLVPYATTDATIRDVCEHIDAIPGLSCTLNEFSSSFPGAFLEPSLSFLKLHEK